MSKRENRLRQQTMKVLALLSIPLALIALTEVAKGIVFSESLYTTYKLIENAVLSDPKAIFKLREAFHPGIPERRWQVDGVQVVAIKLCLTFNPTNESEVCGKKNTTYEEDFRWTNSYLLNLIPGQLLEAMDPLFYRITYSAIVPSSHKRSSLIKLCDSHINLSCMPSWNDFLSASALFLSWSKLYASENTGIPSQWDSKYQGYIAKWHTYLEADPQFPELVQHDQKVLLDYTKWGLFATFTLLNILIPVIFIRRQEHLSRAIALTKNKNILKRLCLVTSMINGGYLLGMVLVHAKKHIPWESTIIQDILALMVAKAIILPTAILIELATAIHTTRKKARYARACSSIWHMLILWQLFVSIQIFLGLVSIPLLIMLLTSPAKCILTLGIVFVPFLLLAFVTVAIPCGKSCKASLKIYWMVGLESVLIACLIVAAFLTYYIIVSSGASMESLMGYVLSIIPAIPISILVWIIKGKVLREKFNINKVKERRLLTEVVVKRRASSTEEEIIRLSDDSAEDASDKE